MSTILKALRQLEDDKHQSQKSLIERVVEPGDDRRSRRRRGPLWLGGGLAISGAALLLAALLPGAPELVAPAPQPTAAVAAPPEAAAASPADLRPELRTPFLAAQVVQPVREAPEPIAPLPAPQAVFVAASPTPAQRTAVAVPAPADPEPVVIPAARSSEARLPANESVARPAAPALRPIDPVAGSAEPAFRPVEPIARPPELEVGSAEPAVRSAEPLAPSADPAARSAAPVARPVEPVLRAGRATTPSAALLEVPELRVEGTVWHPRPARRAADLIGRNGASLHVREGDSVLGYQVLEITPSSVVFGRDGETARKRIGER
jgi:hypothetical protein